MNDNNMTINRIPARTYRWLSMNSASASVFSGASLKVDMDIPDGFSLKERAYEKGLMPTALGEEFDELFVKSDIPEKYITAAAGTRVLSPFKITHSISDNESGFLSVFIDMEKEASGTMILYIRGDGGKNASDIASQIRIRLGERSKLRLVCVAFGDCRSLFLDIGTVQGEGSVFELEQLFLKGDSVYTGCRSDLIGDDSKTDTRIAYEVSGEDSLDMNYIVNHIGKKTTSDMKVYGVLKDNAYKLFRGTIDFKHGAKYAVGNEQEDVLLLDENVVNKTIPLILCAEEDVEGNHGATIGRLSEDLMFYLQSRGISRDEIYEMMANARIDSVRKLIPDEGIIEEIMR